MRSYLIILSTLFISQNLSANELNVHSWQYSDPEFLAVQQGNLLIYCEANPGRCPTGLNKYRHHGHGADGASLFDPSASSTANQTSVVITGDRNSLTLSTEQSSENDSINSEQSGSATIDHEEVLNIGM